MGFYAAVSKIGHPPKYWPQPPLLDFRDQTKKDTPGLLRPLITQDFLFENLNFLHAGPKNHLKCVFWYFFRQISIPLNVLYRSIESFF